jgi:H+/Cl- antiporter ClcA
MPFWSVSLAAFLAALITKNKLLYSFFSAFLSISLLWSFATIFLSAGNEFILLTRVASIFNLTTVPMILLISLVGGLLGGLAAATATQLKNMFRKERPNWQPRYK